MIGCPNFRLGKLTFYLDHKHDFLNKLPTRIINPTKSEIGRISKTILERVNKQIKDQLGLIQWVGTAEVIDWFKNLNNKNSSTFIQFNIVDFYPSISKDLFETALEFAEIYSDISKNEIDILNCRKSIMIIQQRTMDKKIW